MKNLNTHNRLVAGSNPAEPTTNDFLSEANIHYPTDTSLLADGVREITRTVVKLKKEELLELAEEVVAEGREVKARLGALESRPSQADRLGKQPGGWLDAADNIVWQTKAVPGGRLHIA